MDDGAEVEAVGGLTAEELNSGTVRVERRYWVQIKGRWYPTYQGVLDACTRAGIKSLKIKVIQLPGKENEGYAAVSCLLVMEDGREFEEIGDCSPQSTSPALAPASLRLAATRAKARAMRDSINVGTPAADEIGPDRPPRTQQQPRQNAQGQAQRPQQPRQQQSEGNGKGTDPAGFCQHESGCGVEITKNQKAMSQHHCKLDLCPAHLQQMRTAQKS